METNATVQDRQPSLSRAATSSERESKTAVEENAGEVLEGGWAGWSTVAAAFLIQFCGFGLTTSFGVYQDFYTRIYIVNESASTISWIGSMNAFLVSACGLVAGRLYDRGYFYHLVYGGSLLTAFSLFMLSCAKPNHFYQVFLTQGLGAGIGAGVMYVPSLAVISHHFHNRRALAMSIVASGSSFGAVIHPIMLNNTINGSLGFANATRASAGLVSGLLLIACSLIRTKRPPSNVPPIDVGKSLIKFAKDKAYVTSIVANFFFFIGYYFPLFYLQLDAVSHGLSEHFAFYSLVILSFCSFCGRLASGIAARKMGVTSLVVLSTVCCSALIFSMIGLASAASVIIIAVFYGFFAGMYVALLAPLLAILSDDMNELGLRMGVALALAGIGVLIGPPILGAILGKDYIWWRPGVFSGVVTVLGLAFFILMIMFQHRQHAEDERSRSMDIEEAKASPSLGRGDDVRC